MIIIKKKTDPSENDKQVTVKVTARAVRAAICIPQEEDGPISHSTTQVVPLGKPNVTICMRIHAAYHHDNSDLLVHLKKKTLLDSRSFV